MAKGCVPCAPDWRFCRDFVVGFAGVVDIPELDHLVQTACHNMVPVLATPIDSVDLLLMCLNANER